MAQANRKFFIGLPAITTCPKCKTGQMPYMNMAMCQTCAVKAHKCGICGRKTEKCKCCKSV